MNASGKSLASFALVFTLLMVVFQILNIPQTCAGQLENPYQQLVPGLLTRTLFTASSGAGFRVEVRDLLVGPRQTTSPVSLPGAAVFEVRSGSGLVTLAGDSQEVQPGSSFALSEGGEFAIKNETAVPLIIRAHLFLAETP
jgi:hypothetical protein